MDNFLDSVRSRRPTKATAEIAHHTCALIHLGEITCRTRTVLEFDPQAEAITNSKQANGMLSKDYREPYGLPKSI